MRLRIKNLSWRWRILIVVPALLLLAFLVSWASLPEDPDYKGKPLSSWLYTAHSQARVLLPGFGLNRFFQEPRQARDALRAVGPDAVPLLSHWLNATERPWEQWIRKYCQKRMLQNSKVNWARFTAPPRREIALHSMFQIPEHAVSATPILLELISDHRYQAQIALLLERIFDAASATEREWMSEKMAPFITEIIARAEEDRPFPRHVNTLVGVYYRPASFDQRVTAMAWLLRQDKDLQFEGAIQKLDTDPVLWAMATLKLPPHDNSGRTAGAAIYFRDHPVMPERVVPLLIECFSSTNRAVLQRTAQALGSYGIHSFVALPALSNLLSHPQAYVSSAAREAIATIRQAQSQQTPEE